MPDTGVFKFIEDLLTNLLGYPPPDWVMTLIAGLILFGLGVLGLQLIVSSTKKLWTDLSTVRLQLSLPTFEKKYYLHLIYRHRFFDVRGLSTQGTNTLELNDVFVDLKIEPMPLHKISTELFPKIPEGKPIWDFISGEFYDDQKTKTNQQKADRLKELMRWIRNKFPARKGNESRDMPPLYFVVIGPPGSGKTTLLKNITLTLLKKTIISPQGGFVRLIPVMLYLRELHEIIKKDPAITLNETLLWDLSKRGLDVPLGWFKARLEAGDCVVLLDGLDEVPDMETRRIVVHWVQRQITSYGKNRFVMTSRPYGYKNYELEGVAVLEVCPFSSIQIRKFVRNWYLANEIIGARKDDPGIRSTAENGARELEKRLKGSADLMSLAANPLLLTMICTVHRYKSKLPGKRVELYKEICEVFLGQRRQAVGLDLDLAPIQKQKVLQPLAYHMMAENLSEINLAHVESVIADVLLRVSPELQPIPFLKEIENTSGLVMERGIGVYSFTHKTFQEYLASRHIIDHQLEENLFSHIQDDWWKETLLLVAAQSDATKLVEACISEPVLIDKLILAIECNDQALEIHPQTRTKLVQLLQQGVNGESKEFRHLIATALLGFRLQRLVRIDDDNYIDSDLITNAEYQLFLDDFQFSKNDERYYHPDHWQSAEFALGDGLKPIVGALPSDAKAFCDWITRRDGGEWVYRLPLLAETEQELPDAESSFCYWAIKDGIPILAPSSRRSLTISSDQLLVQIHNDIKSDKNFRMDLEKYLDQGLEEESFIGADKEIFIFLDKYAGKIEAPSLRLDDSYSVSFEKILHPKDCHDDLINSSNNYEHIRSNIIQRIRNKNLYKDIAKARDVADQLQVSLSEGLDLVRGDIRSGEIVLSELARISDVIRWWDFSLTRLDPSQDLDYIQNRTRIYRWHSRLKVLFEINRLLSSTPQRAWGFQDVIINRNEIEEKQSTQHLLEVLFNAYVRMSLYENYLSLTKLFDGAILLAKERRTVVATLRK